MQTNGSLDRLHDIYAPPLIGFESSEGFIIISFVVLSVVVSAGYFFILYYQQTSYKREALRELADVKSVEELFNLVKRVLLSTRQRKDVAYLSGDSLLRYIGKGDKPCLLKANQSIYDKRVKVAREDLLESKQEIKKWLKGYSR